MGCKTTKAKEPVPAETAPVSKAAAAFVTLAKTNKHPVAQKLMEEWTIFVDAQAKREAGDPGPAAAQRQRPTEVWAATEQNPVSHHSVDEVGKAFLEYIKADLSQRGWGGNFDFKVAGIARQGFLKANATIDPASSDIPEEVPWEIKIHYHSTSE